MNRIAGVALLAVSFLLLGSAASAEKARPMDVTVTCTCDDATGQAYVSALRHALAKDARYHEVTAAQGYERNAIRINIISMPLEAAEGKPQAALSIVCLHNGTLMHQFVETCTHIPIDQCAESMIQDLGKWDGDAA